MAVRMNRVAPLRAYLYLFGGLNALTAFSVPLLFGDRLLWHPRNLPTDLMVGSVYFAMGMVMLAAAKAPLKHKAFVDFIIIGNILHSIVMIAYAQSFIHIVIDAGFIGAMGVIPLALYPWELKKFLRY